MSSSVTNNPTSAVNDGSGTDWSNPTNVYSSNNGYATIVSPARQVRDSSNLIITGYGFAIPAGSTIDGIKVEMERKRAGTGGSVSDNVTSLTKDGSSGVGSPGNFNTWSTTEGYVAWGGATDLWGTTWTVAEINSANFGYYFSASIVSGSGATCTAYIDHVRITVYYTEPVATSTYPGYIAPEGWQ